MKLRWLVLATLCATMHGQAVRYDNSVTQPAANVPAGAAAAVMTVPNAVITICGYPGVGTPCTNTVQLYQDQGATVPLAQPLQADAAGRFGFWVLPGTYDYSVQTQSGKNVGTFPLSLNSPAGPQGPGGIGCGTGNCIVQIPGGAQNVLQPAGTSLGVNSVNGDNFPGYGYASIQAAVTAAQGSGGQVEVPGTLAAGEMNYPGTDLTQNSGIATSIYTKYTGVVVDDHRPLNHDVSLAQLINLPALDGENEGGDSFRAQKCVQAGHCVVAVIGNSIHENIAGVAPNDGYSTLFAAIQRKFPDTQFQFINLSLGGTGAANFNDATFLCAASGTNTFFRSTPGNWYVNQTENYGFLTGAPYYQWPSGCTIGRSWRQEFDAVAPDITILGFVENAYSQGTQGYINDLTTAVNYIRASGHQSTVILTTDEPSNPSWGPTLGMQFPGIFEALNEATRGFALKNNLLLADADRYYNVLTYGVDPGRRHFQAEHSFQSYRDGWALAVGAEFPALSGSGLASTITWPTPGGTPGGMVQRTRSGIDVNISASFGSTTVGVSVPSIWYRMTPVGPSQSGYKVQTASAISGPNTVWSITLYYQNAGSPSVLQSGTCTIPTATGFVLTVQAKGAKHDVWCNTTNHVIDAWDYNLLSAGQVAVGIQTGGGNVSNEYIYFGNPTQYFTPLVGIQAMLGTPVPPTYSGTGDFQTNPYSFGGDGYHHPNYVGFDSYYLASFKPVLDHLAHTLTVQSIYNVSHTGSSGAFGGLQDGQSGTVDMVDGPAGSRIVNNANNAVRESWGDLNTSPHVFNVPISLANTISNNVAMQIASTASCHPAATNFCTTTMTLPVVEPDASYKVIGCMLDGASGGTSIPLNVSSKTTTSFQFIEYNFFGTAEIGGTVSCMVTHN